MKAINLRCEYLIDPVGITNYQLRLMWNCSDGLFQSAYELIVENEGEILYKSGKVVSNQMYFDYTDNNIPYKSRITWRVRLYDEFDVFSEWSSGFFETGLNETKEWTSNWISGNYNINPFKHYPLDYFKKEFEVESFRFARLYISACGVYEIYINGSKVGSDVLNPGISDYRKVVHYQMYDVSRMLRHGRNIVEIELSNGFFNGLVTKVNAFIEYVDNKGNIKIISTDDSWDWSNDGMIRLSNHKLGEIVDANKVPSYKYKAKIRKYKVIPSASNTVTIKEHERLMGELLNTLDKTKIIDFKQNITGYVSFKVNGHKGDKLVLYFANDINEIKKNKLQKLEYILKEGINEYKTAFTIFAFRYCIVETDLEINVNDFKAIAVYSDITPVMRFSCSNPLINKFVNKAISSIKSDSVDLPISTCNGLTIYTGIMADSFTYLFDGATFIKKYLNDLYTSQLFNGKFPYVVPSGRLDFYQYLLRDLCGFADASVIIPYILYKKYRDKRIIYKYLKGMERYTAHLRRSCLRPHIIFKRSHVNFIDWFYLNKTSCAYEELIDKKAKHKLNLKKYFLPNIEEATAYNIYIHDLIAEMEKIIGDNVKANKYRKYADKVRHAYQSLRDNNPEYTLDTANLSSLIRALAFDLLNAEQEEFAAKRLIEVLDESDWHIDTDLLTTPLMLDVLKDIDVKYAYKLLENEKLLDFSNEEINKYSKISLSTWLFKRMAGIEVLEDNSFLIKPLVNGNINHVTCEYKSIYGTVKVTYKKVKKTYEFNISLPVNTKATVVLIDKSVHEQSAGSQNYVVKGNF